MSNYVQSIIRTWTPIIIGTVAAWLAAKTGVVVDEETKAGLIAATTGFAIGAYYAVIRKLEQKVPAIGWLLGLATQPRYTEPQPPAKD